MAEVPCQASCMLCDGLALLSTTAWMVGPDYARPDAISSRRSQTLRRRPGARKSTARERVIGLGRR